MSDAVEGDEMPAAEEGERESERETEEVEEIYSIVSLKVTRDAIRRNLSRHCCNVIENVLVEGGSKHTVLSRREQISLEIEELRKAHSDYIQALLEDKQVTTDSYSYINENESMVRDVNKRIDHFLQNDADDRSIQSFPLAIRDDYRSADNMSNFDCNVQLPSAPSCSGHRPFKRYRVSSEPDQLSERADWIDQRQSTAVFQSNTVNPMWMMNMIPQLKIEPFAGDPREWPIFISSFKDMIHDVLPSNSQRFAVLKQLLTSEVRSYISEHFDSAANYFDALAELRKRYGQPQVVARAHLTSLMNLPTIKEDDYSDLSKFSRTLHGAMYALRNGGYEQDLEAGMTLEHVVRKLPPRMRNTWGIKVYKMTPQRATLKHLAHWLDEIVMGEMMTRPCKSKNKDRSEQDSGKSRTSFTSGTKPTILMTDSQSKLCHCCGKTHSIEMCPLFKGLSVVDRAEWARDKKLCFRCLEGLHRSAECPSKTVCTVADCGQRHHFLIHGAPRMFPPKSGGSEYYEAKESRPKTNGPTVNSIERLSVTTLLNVVPVILQANGKIVHTHALLDNGSDVSLVRADIARSLNLTGKIRELTFGTFHGNDPPIETASVNFTLKSLDESFITKTVQASTVPNLKLPKRSYSLKNLQRRWPHLRDVNSEQVDFGDVTVLIGADVQEAHQHLDYRKPPQGTIAPFGILTPFGWCCVGPIPEENKYYDEKQRVVLSIHEQQLANDELHKKVEKFWETESLSLLPNLNNPESEDEKRARELVRATTTFDGTHFVVGLPWTSPTVTLTNNYEAALRRLRSIEHRFQRDKGFAEKYTAVIQDYIQNGFARKIKASEIDSHEGRTWYLPHHGVINPQKPAKVRVVFDASAQHGGKSLNDVLMKGPNLLNDIVAVLLLFRERAVSLSGDIKQMFLQVKVQPEDQAALRFLWRSPGNRTPPTIYQMQVQIFGAISSPFICSNILQYNAEQHRQDFPGVADRIKKNFYVDNLLDSFDTEDEAIKASKEYSSLLKRGGFHLNQWMSSSRRVLAALPKVDLSNPLLNIDLEDLPVERTLGVLYDSECDVFIFKINLDAEANTKRRILSVVATVYDPLGFLSPVILIAKKILQEIWTSGCGWDDVVEDRILTQWKRWTQNLPLLESIKIPRPIAKSPRPRLIQIHAFCDASTVGFGAVTYLRVVSNEGTIMISFVLSKSRVAPLRPLTIPRLELQGAVVALRLVKKIISSLRLPINQVFYWSDSKTILQWIKSKTCRFHTFVANRVAEILDGSNSNQWFHVPGIENPADECSRGLFPTDLDQNHRWFNGPAFLHSHEESWPNQMLIGEPLAEDPELTKTKWAGFINQSKVFDGINKIMLKSSSFFRCCRSVAWVLRYISNLKLKVMKQPIRLEFLTVPELKKAKTLCIQQAQQDCFFAELKAIRKGNSIRSDSKIAKLSPFLDQEGLLRVGGRIEQGDFSFNVKHPILIPHDHPLSKLIIMEEHALLRHPSTERLLSSLRTRFWIIRGRLTVKRYVNQCFTCKRRHQLPEIPLMASLPRCRIEPFQPPFTNTGLDYFGPYYVTVVRSKVKRYVLLFTCLVTRAVHLEWTASMDTDSFLMAFQRFVHRKGSPAVVYSDNGTQIVAGDKEIKKCLAQWNLEKIHGAMSRRSIQWNYSPPAAPHFGGVWERLVKSAKIALNSIMDSRSLSDEMLLTILAEVESLLNGRPLTHISVDPRDPEPLTPNHFLLGRANPNIPMDVFDNKEISSKRTWRAAQVMVNHFWRRWLKEYLPTITERKKWLKRQPNLEIDDVVLIVNPDSPRGHWPIGRVLQVNTGQDGVVRSAVVKTATGEYLRPAAKLCLLEKDVFEPNPKTDPAVTDAASVD